MALKILLLQARRENDPSRIEERRSFAQKAGVDVNQIVPHDLLEGPPTLAEVRRHDALMIGDSGDFYVSKRNLHGFDSLLELLAEVAELGHPTFASCFGFQCMVAALGGEVIHDPRNTEVGTYRLTLTEKGRKDELFGALPLTFAAQLGRKDRAAKLPQGVENLAASPKAPFQALRIPGKPVWASQFHPELDRRTNRERFLIYLDGYSAHMSEEERAKALEQFEESPETSRLLSKFLQLVFG